MKYRRYRAGDLIGKWRVLGILGAGAMGVVYEVEHRSMGRPAALKVLKLSGPRAEVMASKMLDEARMLGRLRHPNLVEVLDACDDGGDEFGHWFVMVRLCGRDLTDVIQQEGPLQLARALNYAEQIASAAACAHDVNVIHRDLKPDNIHVSEKEVVTVMDFGAGRFNRGATLNLIVGTVPYMSPEQICKVATLDGRSDVFALGLILHEMVTGTHIYRDADGRWLENGQVFRTTVSPEPVSSFDNIDACVRSILVRATAKDRDQRYPSMDAFAAGIAQLRKTLGGQSYASTERLTAEAVSGAISVNRSVQTDPMTSTEAAAVARNAQPADAPSAQSAKPSTLHGSYFVVGGLAALALGMGGALLLTSSGESAPTSNSAEADDSATSASPTPSSAAASPSVATSPAPAASTSDVPPAAPLASASATTSPSATKTTTAQAPVPPSAATQRPQLTTTPPQSTPVPGATTLPPSGKVEGMDL